MNSGKYVFAQLLQFINRYEFEKCVSKYNGDFRTRNFNCWNQFIQLFFGQLTSRNSLRDICVCLKAHKNKLYPLGIRRYVNQSSLYRQNERRDCRDRYSVVEGQSVSVRVDIAGRRVIKAKNIHVTLKI